MHITGELLIGRQAVTGNASALRGIDPVTGHELEPSFTVASTEQVNRACALAEQAFGAYRLTSLHERAVFLEAIAEEIVALGDTLIQRASLESGLPLPRETGERDRTANQLRLFASTLRAGRYLDPRIDPAQPQRQPMPRPDLRQQRMPLGPVVVFGASNFPLAFSVAGGDTASALAAGCPVIVKAHPAHPGTSELVGRAIQRAAEKTGMPDGVFSLLHGVGVDLGGQLVLHPAIKAVGFTGSRQGGLALIRLAAQREVPIPVYAEMSAINPVYVLPAALAARGASIAQGFADSVAMGAGQFCTNPGLVLGLAGADWQAFVDAASAALGAKPAGVMLTAGIHDAYLRNVGALGNTAGVVTRTRGAASDQPNTAQAALFETTASAFMSHKPMADEVFGPSSLLVRCENEAELLKVSAAIEGQLTATLQMDEGDMALAKKLVPILELKVGRILANGYPTGVEVSSAMVHGGPFPATSDGRSTSVGTASIERFLRPICYQDLPDALLPDSLKKTNPLELRRLVDGNLSAAPV